MDAQFDLFLWNPLIFICMSGSLQRKASSDRINFNSNSLKLFTRSDIACDLIK